ncbi:MAG: hypothetical protein MJY52_02205 [Bacteroidaceae bacterium]|nr:hypothetical protein [Bacteroidaceae bacterium]
MKKLKFIIVLFSVMILASCINDDYDLSDIETTIGIPVEGLEVPINIEATQLESVLKIDENSIIKKDENGYYLIKEGDFGPSNPIKVNTFTAAGPTITPIVSTLDLQGEMTRKKMATGELIGYYNLKESSTSVSTNASGIDKAIVEISELGATAELKVSLSISGIPQGLKAIHFENVQMAFLKGLELDLEKSKAVKSWNKITGDLALNDLETDKNGNISISVYVKGIGLKDNTDIKFHDHMLDIKGTCKIQSGRVAVYTGDIDVAALQGFVLPDHVGFTCSPYLSDINVNTFSGNINYDITNINVAPVELNDIPEVLNQTGTALGVSNPQIYLSVNNPVYQYNIGATCKMSIGNEREGKKYDEVTSEKIAFRATPATHDNYFCLSPEKPACPYIYKDKEMDYVVFDTKYILDCYDLSSRTHVGIPDKLNIKVNNPNINGIINNFVLGTELEAVRGTYSFYAPVELTENSKINYAKTFNEWNDSGNLDDVEIDSMEVNFLVTTDVPYRLKLDIEPLTNGGKKIEGVTVTIPEVEPLAQQQEVKAIVKGTIKALDGMNLKADVVSEKEAQLRPDMTILLEDVKAKVYGMYIKKDE